MNEDLNKKVSEYFNVKYGTFKFLLITLLTGYYYGFYWIFNFIKKVINNEKDRRNIIIHFCFVAGMFFWVQVVFTSFLESEPIGYTRHISTPFILHMLLSTILLVAGIILPFLVKSHLQKFFNANNINITVKGVWTFFFNFIYFYFLLSCVKKGDYLNKKIQEKIESDTTNQIRELKKLLDEGVITAEDFDKKKRKMLGL